jgi:hypothetical protein
MMQKYYLKGKVPVPCDSLMVWRMAIERDRAVAKTHLPGGVEVSTVFLGLDHNWGGGEPLLFETMIFGGELDGEQWRYSTWEEAEKGHKRACGLVSKTVKPTNKPLDKSKRKFDFKE